MTSFNVAPFHLCNKEHGGKVQRYNSNIGVGILFFYAYDWLSLQNECILLPWSLVSIATPAFYEWGGGLSNTVAMATFTRFLLKVTANLIDTICYYASRMNGPSFLKCVIVNLLQNVVRSLLSAGGPNIGRVGTFFFFFFTLKSRKLYYKNCIFLVFFQTVDKKLGFTRKSRIWLP